MNGSIKTIITEKVLSGGGGGGVMEATGPKH